MSKSPVRIEVDSPRAFAAEPRSPGGPDVPHPDVVAVESVNRELRSQIDNQQGKIKELESKLEESEASRRRLLLAADAVRRVGLRNHSLFFLSHNLYSFQNTVVAEPVSPVISSDTVELQRLRQQLSELRSDFNALLREKEQLSATVDSLEQQKHEMHSQHQASIAFLERQTNIIQPQLIELPSIVELPLSQPQSTESKAQKPVSLLDDMEDDDLPAAVSAPQATSIAEPSMRDYFMATFKALQQKFGSTVTQSVNITELWLSAEQSNLPFQYYYEWIELEIGKHIAHDSQSDSDGSNLVQSITAFQKLREQLLHKRAEIDVLRKQSTELQQKLGLPTSFLLSDTHADTNTEADTSGDNKMSFSKLLDTAKAKSRALSGAASPKAGAVSPKTTAGGDDGNAPWAQVMDSISDSITDSLSTLMTASLPLTEDEIRLQKGVGLARKSVPRTPKQGTSSATTSPDKAKASLLMRFTDFLFGPDEF
jgi:predicted nuclease with TOPRIM domain